MVGAINDPATPYVWAPKLTSELGNAVLLTFEGEGHGAYGQTACVTDAVDAYLINGTVPKKGTVCPAISVVEVLAEVGLHLVERDALLRHRVALADRHRVVVEGVEVDA